MGSAENPSVIFTPQDEPQDLVTFDQFRDFAVSEVNRRFAALVGPGADVPPFLAVAGPSVLGVLDWSWTDEEFLPEIDLLMDEVPDAISEQGKQTYLTMAGLAVTTYLHALPGAADHAGDDASRIEAVLLALLSVEGAGEQLVLSARIDRTEGSAPQLADFEKLEGDFPANIGEPMVRGLELGIPDSESFTGFVEEGLPEYLEYAIDAVGEDWDGSPFFVLGIPERDDLEGHILTGDGASDRVQEMFTIIRNSDDLPVVGAYVVSAPLFRPSGLVPKEGMLLMSCADGEGRQAETARRLSYDEDGAACLSDLPDDVQPGFMPSETVRFLVSIMGVASLARGGLLRLGEENWQLLLSGTLERLEAGSR